MRVYMERSRATYESAALTVAALLAELKLNPDTVLVTRKGVLLTEDALLRPDDDLVVLSVISGG